MPEQKKISIIIPCYNATAYIEACIQNLEQQTIGMEHLEIILVNDASTDQTYDLLCEVEKNSPNPFLSLTVRKMENKVLLETLDYSMHLLLISVTWTSMTI